MGRGESAERITIEDIAARAGVSPTTVSHAFSGHRPVSAATRALVQQVASELGYRPNAIATSLRVRRTNTAMIVLPDITNPFFPVFARGVQDVLRRRGYHTLLCNTDSREEEERAFLEEAMSRRLDGLVFMGYWVAPAELLALAAMDMAVVNLGEGVSGGPLDNVRSRDREASADATGYLLERYGTSVAFIDGMTEAPVSQSRSAGFRDAFSRTGAEVPPHYVVSAGFTRDGGRRAMSVLLDLPAPPRAVFCANDLIALGALDAAETRGLGVPGDVAVAGFDDIDLAAMTRPSLTTVRNSPAELGAATGELLLSRMSGAYEGEGREVVVPATLVHRESA